MSFAILHNVPRPCLDLPNVGMAVQRFVGPRVWQTSHMQWLPLSQDRIDSIIVPALCALLAWKISQARRTLRALSWLSELTMLSEAKCPQGTHVGRASHIDALLRGLVSP